MDKLMRYRTLIKQALTERANLMQSQPLPGEEVICVLDEATDNYLLLRMGWVRGKRLYSVTLHLRLVDGKVQVEQDWADDFLSKLIGAGICREDVIFALTSPELYPRAEVAAV